MSKDITPILKGWDHEPVELQVRIIPGLDGQEKLQLRLDLGVLQMELQGRPDGQKPYEFESLLDYLEHCAQDAKGRSAAYSLDAEQCEALMREGMQYYHRYVALFHLGRYDLVARDTTRNLRLFDFVRAYASRKRDRMAFEQYRPYVTMMKIRSTAQPYLDREDYREALRLIDEGIEEIKTFLTDYELETRSDDCQELLFLRQWRLEIDRERSADPVERLEDQLSNAIAREDYEEAARLRDQIQRLRAVSPSDPSRSGLKS